MSTYAEKDYDSNNYQKNRPGYPRSLFKAIFDYHEGQTKKALDVGCGPGTASFPLLEYVDQVIATDPSVVMIKPGIEDITPELKDKIRFYIAPAEDLSHVVQDGSIDVITSAEALHWVNHEKFFKEAARVLKSGGTLAYWGYIEPRFIDYPQANEIYERYAFEDLRYMGPEWKSGKDYLRYFFNDVKIPTETFTDIEKHDYYPGETVNKTAYYLADHKYTMKKFRHYLSSWSAYHSWMKNHPDAEKDVVELFIDELKTTLGWTDDTEIRVEWGTTYVFARRR